MGCGLRYLGVLALIKQAPVISVSACSCGGGVNSSLLSLDADDRNGDVDQFSAKLSTASSAFEQEKGRALHMGEGV